MKTKREVLEEIVEKGHCIDIMCSECPYNPSSYCAIRLRKVGAMAILRMFPEKKKPLLSVGTKIKFDDGSIAKIELTTAGHELMFYTINGCTSRSLSYLLGRTWEVVE